MSDWYTDAAENDFDRARTRGFLHRVAGFVTFSRDRLLSFEEVRRLVKPSGETYAGLQEVAIDKIVGSEGRYRDFDRHFLPRREHLKSRWVSVDKAHYEDIILPPVRLYALGGVYFVRDGNHRISVARTLGQVEIDAEVTFLESSIALEPGMDMDSLRRAILDYEKRRFHEKTGYLRITGVDDLAFSEPGRFDTVMEHILVHKYYINQNQRKEIGFDQALWSWHENVYGPLVLALQEEGLLSLFPGRTASDLYLFLVHHWDDLKKKYGIEYGIGEAVRDFRKGLAASGGRGPAAFLRSVLSAAKNFLGKRRGDL